jgi:hypothetical protein
MTTRLYSHDDVGAPSHSGTGLGQILTIIRACLVDGYGTRTAAGWTMPFSDLPNNKAVFRGASGAGDYFRIDDNIDNEYSQIFGYATMTDVDNGTENYPKIGIGINDDDNNWQCINRDGVITGEDAWYVIANEEFCWLIFYGSTTYRSVMFFGEYERVAPTSTVPNYLVMGTHYVSTVSASILEYTFITRNATYEGVYQRRNQWDDIQRNTKLGFIRDDLLYSQPSPLDGKFRFRPIEITNDAAPYSIWGKMPDVVHFKNTDIADAFNPIGDRLTIEGASHVLLRTQADHVFAFRYDLDVG